jgi:anhydro-N-acetylmuramic acid kinase
VHGQTVFHRPPLGWQLMQPAPIAAAFGVPVAFDLRAADLARGGQGAPITPIADVILYGGLSAIDVVNLGGFCNITHLPPRDAGLGNVRGSDVCACNQLLDAISRLTTGAPYDKDGNLAAGAVPDPAISLALAALLKRQSGSGRSLGTGDELHAWIESVRHDLTPGTLAATGCESLGRVIGARLTAPTAVLAGGGVRNSALTAAIRRHSGADISTSDQLGLPCEYREAAAFAILGVLCQDRVPITLPQVTGVRGAAPISGCWVLP